MARNKTIKFIRTTKTNLDTQAGLGNLVIGEPYFITDTSQFAIGTSTTTYQIIASGGGGGFPSGGTAGQVLVKIDSTDYNAEWRTFGSNIKYNSTSFVNESASSLSTLTWSHTCNAADNKLIVAVGGRAGISGVTYNGVAMTLVDHRDNDFSYQYSAVYYLDNPDVGAAHNIVVTYSSANSYRMGAAVGLSGSYSGVGVSANNSFDYTYGTLSVSRTPTSIFSDLFIVFWANTAFISKTDGGSQEELIKNTANNGAFYLQRKQLLGAVETTASIITTSNYNQQLFAFEIQSV